MSAVPRLSGRAPRPGRTLPALAALTLLAACATPPPAKPPAAAATAAAAAASASIAGHQVWMKPETPISTCVSAGSSAFSPW